MKSLFNPPKVQSAKLKKGVWLNDSCHIDDASASPTLGGA